MKDDYHAQLCAELDAYYARLYGLTRDELRYILDPKEVHGDDFPDETFRVLKEKEVGMHHRITFSLFVSMLIVIACSDRAAPAASVAATSTPEIMPTATLPPTQTPIPRLTLPSGSMCDFISKPLLKEVFGEQIDIERDGEGQPGNTPDASCIYYVNAYGSVDREFFLFINALEGDEGRRVWLQAYEQLQAAKSEPGYCSFSPEVPLSPETEALITQPYTEILTRYVEAFNSACSPFSLEAFKPVPGLGDNAFSTKGFFRVLYEPTPSANIMVLEEDAMIWLSLQPVDSSFIHQYDPLLPDRESPYAGDREEKRRALSAVFPLLEPYVEILERIAQKAFLDR